VSYHNSVEFRKTFESNDVLQRLCSKALNGKLRNSHIRSIVWKIFLGICNNKDWSTIHASRESYERLIEKHTLDPHKIEVEDVNVMNPLSQSTSVRNLKFLLTFFRTHGLNSLRIQNWKS
jgi:hypothetical protein